MKRLTFSLKCNCGDEIKGIFTEYRYSDTLHCNCGLVWLIPRPYQGREEDNHG